MKQTINIIRGTSTTIKIVVKNANGTNYTLSGSDRLRFVVKKNPRDTSAAIAKELSSSNYNNGAYLLQLSPSDTNQLECGRYFYDCGLRVGGEYYMIIELSQFNLLQNISSVS